MKYQPIIDSETTIKKLQQEVRAWAIVVENLKKQNAPIGVWKNVAGEISRRVKEINRLQQFKK